MVDLRLATFAFDATPPLGHPLCGGLVKPAAKVDDPLEGLGLALLGAGPPIVLCTLDWTGVCNGSHAAWRAALAQAAGTTPDRVALHSVHQHDAPFACAAAHGLAAAHADLSGTIQPAFFQQCLDRSAAALRAALPLARAVTGVSFGAARVEQVASNRRVQRDAAGKVLAMRGSSCRNPALRALPEGLVDPLLRTVAFHAGPQKIAACTYYAVHPMSHYGQGVVGGDFVGLARKRRRRDEPGCHRLWFTGAAGNVAAGKYNDGSPPVRAVLAERLHAAAVAAERNPKPEPVTAVQWRAAEFLPAPRARALPDAALRAKLADAKLPAGARHVAAFELAWRQRVARRQPLPLSALELNGATLLHLPGEAFVEQQLAAQALAKGRFLATAAYGDGGPWYLPTKTEYPLGGYEVSAAFCDADAGELLMARIATLVG